MDHLTPRTDLYSLPFEAKDFRNMPYRRLGNSGLRVSDIGLGTWKMGYPETGDGARVDREASLGILSRAAELGVTFWDTANRYNNASGNSERIIGQWFQNNPSERRNIVLCTKVAGLMDGRTPNHCGLSRVNIMESVYASLERLQTDVIDVLYFHAHDPATPAEESLAAIEDLVKQDLVRYFAVSNFSVTQLKEYKDLESRFSIRSRAVAVQNQFDVISGEREPFDGVLEYTRQFGQSFIAWSPMAGGLISDRYLDPNNAGPGDRLYDEGVLGSRITDVTLQKLKSLGSVASEAGVSLSQLVLAFMRTLPAMGPIITSASNIDQLESNAAAAFIDLNESQSEKIREILS